MSTIFTSKCAPWTPIDVFLKHQKIHSKHNSKLSKNNIVASQNKIDIIKEILNNGIILSYDTILTFAENGYIDSVKYLLKVKKNDGNMMFPMNETLFNHACMSGNLQLIKFLVDNNCPQDESALIHIISNNHPIYVITWALDNFRFGLNWYLQYGNGCKLNGHNNIDIIIAAVGTGNLNTLKFLIEKGFVNTSDDNNITNLDLLPLKCACELPFRFGKPIIKLLIEKKYKYDTSILYWRNDDSKEDIVNRWALLFELCKFDKKDFDYYKIKNKKWIETEMKNIFNEKWMLNVGFIDN